MAMKKYGSGGMKKTAMQKGGVIGKLKKKKRRTVSVTTKNPRPGTVGGSPVTTKTVTKRRGDKTITKTKSVRNPIGPFKSTVSKSKTVSKAGPKGPMGMSQKRTVKSKGSNKQVSQKRGQKIEKRMQTGGSMTKSLTKVLGKPKKMKSFVGKRTISEKAAKRKVAKGKGKISYRIGGKDPGPGVYNKFSKKKKEFGNTGFKTRSLKGKGRTIRKKG